MSDFRVDPRKARTRRVLYEALLDILGEMPFSAITVRALAARAGISYATFFRHHPSIESVLDEIAKDEIDEVIARALATYGEKDKRSAAKAIFSYIDENRLLWSTLLTGGAAAKIREEFLIKAREAAIEFGGTNKKIPMDCGIVLIVCSTIELIDWWLRGTRPLSIDRVAEIFDLAIVSPIMEANGFEKQIQRSKEWL